MSPFLNLLDNPKVNRIHKSIRIRRITVAAGIIIMRMEVVMGSGLTEFTSRVGLGDDKDDCTALEVASLLPSIVTGSDAFDKEDVCPKL